MVDPPPAGPPGPHPAEGGEPSPARVLTYMVPDEDVQPPGALDVVQGALCIVVALPGLVATVGLAVATLRAWSERDRFVPGLIATLLAAVTVPLSFLAARHHLRRKCPGESRHRSRRRPARLKRG